MLNNLEKYKKDLDALIRRGDLLFLDLQKKYMEKEQFEKIYRKSFGEEYDNIIDEIPMFDQEYQCWYSEALELIVQLLPNRLEDFKNYYGKSEGQCMAVEDYKIKNYLSNAKIFGFSDISIGIEHISIIFKQQIGIIKAVRSRFESSLFNIKQLIQADVFDSELESAKELLKKGFLRGAGAMAGVVLETHLSDVCGSHFVEIKKSNLTISDYNNGLKDKGVYDIATWRQVQCLGDLRNLCDHKKSEEPTEEKVRDLIEGVEKIIKTCF